MSVLLHNITSQFLFDIPACSTDTLISKVQRIINICLGQHQGHHIPATANPTCVPLHRILGHYKQEIYSKFVLRGIIEESFRP